MGRTATAYFGEIDYEEQSVLTFQNGMPGFESHTEFLVLEQSASRPLVFLQSLRQEGPCFTAIPVRLIRPDYQLDLSPEEQDYFAETSRADSGLLCLGVLSVDEEGWTVNLLAPVVIDPVQRLGLQVIQTGKDYSHREPVFRAQAVC